LREKKKGGGERKEGKSGHWGSSQESNIKSKSFPSTRKLKQKLFFTSGRKTRRIKRKWVEFVSKKREKEMTVEEKERYLLKEGGPHRERFFRREELYEPKKRTRRETG